MPRYAVLYALRFADTLTSLRPLRYVFAPGPRHALQLVPRPPGLREGDEVVARKDTYGRWRGHGHRSPGGVGLL